MLSFRLPGVVGDGRPGGREELAEMGWLYETAVESMTKNACVLGNLDPWNVYGVGGVESGAFGDVVKGSYPLRAIVESGKSEEYLFYWEIVKKMGLIPKGGGRQSLLKCLFVLGGGYGDVVDVVMRQIKLPGSGINRVEWLQIVDGVATGDSCGSVLPGEGFVAGNVRSWVNAVKLRLVNPGLVFSCGGAEGMKFCASVLKKGGSMVVKVNLLEEDVVQVIGKVRFHFRNVWVVQGFAADIVCVVAVGLTAKWPSGTVANKSAGPDYYFDGEYLAAVRGILAWRSTKFQRLIDHFRQFALAFPEGISAEQIHKMIKDESAEWAQDVEFGKY